MPRKKKTIGAKGRRIREKGYLFENVVEEYFRISGFRIVGRNVRLRGFSGAMHEVDVLIESPDKKKFLVEAKNYSSPIPKEWVMKAYSVAKDLGLAGSFVVSASGFSDDAVKIAEVLGVQLLDLNAMAEEVRRHKVLSEAEVLYVKPALSEKDAIKVASKHAIKVFFKAVESPTEVTLLYHPFYLVKGTRYILVEEGLIFKKEVERAVDVSILVDSVRGGIPIEDNGVLDIVEISSLSSNEIELLKALLDFGEATASELSKELGWSRQKVYVVLKKLEEKGLVEASEEESNKGRIVKVYSTTLPNFEEISSLLPEASDITTGIPKKGKALQANAPSHIAKLVAEIYNIEAKSIRLIYLPIYKVKLEKKDRSYRYIDVIAW